MRQIALRLTDYDVFGTAADVQGVDEVGFQMVGQ